MNKQRGVVLVLVLLLSALILVMGMAFLTKQAGRYRAARETVQASQARALAVAGLEKARAKLNHDLHYPPPLAQDQPRFSYTEPVLNLAGEEVGFVTVTHDLRYLRDPYRVLVIRATGLVGSAANPQARRTLEAELDMAVLDRSSGSPNPDYFQFIRYRDLGGL